ncbi:MAG: tripartite tricarboxylate transporter TctB family protein [Verrucomicrobia bacterium]|nr:tripartite tricarboxylate transporter TctB family protein [Verrucomicrobiota bacterium]
MAGDLLELKRHHTNSLFNFRWELRFDTAGSFIFSRMMSTSQQPIQDYIISGCTIVLAGLVLWGAQDIPPPFFDPLGSAAVPKVCAYLLILIALGICIRRYFENRAGSNSNPEAEGYKSEPWLALAVVAMSILYTLAMGSGWIGFRWGTVIYIFVTGSILARKHYPVMGLSLALGLLIGIGGQYLFTQIFYIDLP